MGRITNTARDDRHPEWVLGARPGAIEAQEAEGQAQLVASGCLPSKMSGAARAALEEWGVRFGADVEGDPLFVHAELPPGWRLRARPDHAMWSDLVDADGKVRANVFYKAAFYDRGAFLRLASA